MKRERRHSLADNPDALLVRDAATTDLPALCRMKAGEALHHDRIRDAAASPNFRYLVLARGGDVIGFACLVFVRPASWSDADDLSNLPQIVDLLVSPPLRSRGYGSAFIREMERIAAGRGMRSLSVAVDFPANARAHALYQKLGFRQIHSEPYLCHWEFTDSEGHVHQGDDWRVDMVRSLL